MKFLVMMVAIWIDLRFGDYSVSVCFAGEAVEIVDCEERAGVGSEGLQQFRPMDGSDLFVSVELLVDGVADLGVNGGSYGRSRNLYEA